jgi:hypothetical protein
MMEKESRDRLIGRTIVGGWEVLGRLDRIMEHATKIFIPFVVGLFLGYLWGYKHFGPGL